MWIPQMFLRSLPYEPQFPGCEDASIPHDGTKQSAARGYRRRGERARRGLEEPRRSAAEAGRATSIWRPGTSRPSSSWMTVVAESCGGGDAPHLKSPGPWQDRMRHLRKRAGGECSRIGR